ACRGCAATGRRARRSAPSWHRLSAPSLEAAVLRRLFERPEWKFFAVLPRADFPLAIAWWGLLLLRGTLPVAFALGMGELVHAVQAGASLAAPLVAVGSVFVLLQVLTPLHAATSANLGSRVSAWLYDRLTEACVRPPAAGHPEDPNLPTTLTARPRFDPAPPGPPTSLN